MRRNNYHELTRPNLFGVLKIQAQYFLGVETNRTGVNGYGVAQK